VVREERHALALGQPARPRCLQLSAIMARFSLPLTLTLRKGVPLAGRLI
jgi:hypothetical protein